MSVIEGKYMTGKQRTVRAELYKQTSLTHFTNHFAWLLLPALRSWADDDGNVYLNMELFAENHASFLVTQFRATPEQLESAIQELVAKRWLVTYTVRGHRYASIWGFNDEEAPMYSNKVSDKTKWRYPKPEEADGVGTGQPEVVRSAIKGRVPSRNTGGGTRDVPELVDGGLRGGASSDRRSRRVGDTSHSREEVTQAVVERPKKTLPRRHTPPAPKSAPRANESRLVTSPPAPKEVGKRWMRFTGADEIAARIRERNALSTELRSQAKPGEFNPHLYKHMTRHQVIDLWREGEFGEQVDKSKPRMQQVLALIA